MKQDLQNKLVEILTGIQTAVGKASDFALEQLPDIAMQYVAWGRVSSAFYITLILVGAALSVTVFAWGLRECKRVPEALMPAIAMMASVAAMAMAIVPGLFSIPGLLLPWIAPKVWLIKEIAGLVK